MYIELITIITIKNLNFLQCLVHPVCGGSVLLIFLVFSLMSLILFVLVPCLVYPMLLVYLDYPFGFL